MSDLPKVILSLGLLAGFLWSAKLSGGYLWDGQGSLFALIGAMVFAAIAIWLFVHLRTQLLQLKADNRRSSDGSPRL